MIFGSSLLPLLALLCAGILDENHYWSDDVPVARNLYLLQPNTLMTYYINNKDPDGEYYWIKMKMDFWCYHDLKVNADYTECSKYHSFYPEKPIFDDSDEWRNDKYDPYPEFKMSLRILPNGVTEEDLEQFKESRKALKGTAAEVPYRTLTSRERMCYLVRRISATLLSQYDFERYTLPPDGKIEYKPHELDIRVRFHEELGFFLIRLPHANGRLLRAVYGLECASPTNALRRHHPFPWKESLSEKLKENPNFIDEFVPEDW